MNQLLFRTLMSEPDNEPFLRGIIKQAILTGEQIERTRQEQVISLQEIRDIRKILEADDETNF